jgi:hypothetical protein
MGTFVKQGRFKSDIVNKPNELQYFIDYLEPVDKLYGVTVDDVNPKIYSYQEDKINKLYLNTIPNFIVLDQSMDNNYKAIVAEKCDSEGQPYSIIENEVYSHFAIGTTGYAAQETARELLYQYTGYNETISIQCIPIYYLDVNRRITVRDIKSNIKGDYVINAITIPLTPDNVMSITATRALDRI